MSEKKYRITVDKTTQVTKPNKKEIKEIHKRLIDAEETTIPEFMEFIANGYTWSGGVFDGNLKNVNWGSQSIFGLDFDNNRTIITPEVVISRFKEFNIVPQVLYETFSSSKDLMKFRVVLFIDHEISKKEDFNFLTNGLKLIFPEADNRCFSMCTFFFAGNNPQLISNEPIQLENLIHMTTSHYYTSCQITRRLKKALDGSSFYNYSNSAQIREILYKNNYSNSHFCAQMDKNNKVEKIDWNVARSRVKILDEFFNGYWLDHMSIFYLATNMIQINGGIKKKKDIMTDHNKTGRTSYTDNNFSIFSYIKFLQYPAIPISVFSPFPEDAELHDMLGEIRDQRGKIEILVETEKISLKEAEEKFEKEFNRVMEEGETGNIYIFKLPTALGKTKKLTNLENVTIALPTNKLKNEISQRMEVEITRSPDAIQFNDNVNIRKYQSIFVNGNPEEGIKFIKNVAKENSEDSLVALTYLDESFNLRHSPETLVITHDRAIISDFQHSTLIFDEDPIDKILEINQMSISDLEALITMHFGNNQDFINLFQILEDSQPNMVQKTPAFAHLLEPIKNLMKNINISLSNIPMFLESDYFIKDSMIQDKIHYIKKNELTKSKKIIILSATINPMFYQQLFDERVYVFDLGEVEMKGKIIQYTKRSCSRKSLSKYVTKISEEVGDSTVITFKAFVNSFTNCQKEIYFGNCSGYDFLSNQNLTVVGTPHLNNIKYFLFANIFGINYAIEDTEMTYQWINHNGFRFKFNTFGHEGLRNIHLSLIQSEIVQAVGRARTLRYDCKVSLYSNFPLKQSSEFIY